MIPVLWDSPLLCLCLFLKNNCHNLRSMKESSSTQGSPARTGCFHGHQALSQLLHPSNMVMMRFKSTRALDSTPEQRIFLAQWGFQRRFLQNKVSDNRQLKGEDRPMCSNCLLSYSCRSNISLHVQHTCEISQQRCQGWDTIERVSRFHNHWFLRVKTQATLRKSIRGILLAVGGWLQEERDLTFIKSCPSRIL